MGKGNRFAMGAALLALALLTSASASAFTIYQTRFDNLATGTLQPAPGAAGQDEWSAAQHPGGGYGEIQDVVGQGGAALRLFSPRTNPDGAVVADERPLTPPDLAVYPLVTLEFDARFGSDDLSTSNPFEAVLALRGGPAPGFDIVKAIFAGGNGQPKSQTGVGLVLYSYNGSDNNVDIPLTVGQHLAWDAWHHVRLSIDQAADRYASVTVDGHTQDLSAHALPREEVAGQWLRGQLLENLDAFLAARAWELPNRSDDTAYWDNLAATAANAQGAVLPAADGLTENGATQWGAEADGSTATVSDDLALVHDGTASLRFDTAGCFDTRLWTPLARDAQWDLSWVTALTVAARAQNANFSFQNDSPWFELHTTTDDYVELHATGELLNDAQTDWRPLRIPLGGDATWQRTDHGAPDLSRVAWLEIHADTWDCGFTLWLDGLTFESVPSVFAGWQMLQRDMRHTGRADFVVPAERMNGSFFDVFAWQTPTPGSPDEGGLGSTSLVFADGAGPGGADLVVGGYHWPKGVLGLDRHTGATFWSGNPDGGESIGARSPAFAPDGATVYVTNDATDHPLMGFAAATGPATYRHNGGDLEPYGLQMNSPVVGPDGRLFAHGWTEGPRAGLDDGTRISETWAAATALALGLADAALDLRQGQLRVVAAGREGVVACWDGTSGAELWRTAAPSIDATATIDPATGNVYVGAGSGSVWIVGLDRDGQPLWGDVARLCHDYVEGVNEPERAQSAGCLGHDGSTYYFQTVGQAANGRLYAIDTATGVVRWTWETGSAGWEQLSSSPIVTPNGVLVVGNNDGGAYFSLRDAGDHAELLDTLNVDAGGNARACPTLAADGRLYLPLRVAWTKANGNGGTPSGEPANLFCSLDLAASAQAMLPPPAGLVAIALNQRVDLTWRAVTDASGIFDHYAVYRGTKPFTSVAGLTPIGTATAREPGLFSDASAVNGTSYWYAVTTVTGAGVEETAVTAVGPRTPRDETDLQVVCMSRTPRFPRWEATYTGYEITEPGGFGPYFFSAATGLGGGQTFDTPRWPQVDDPVTFTATLRNRGTNPVTDVVGITWLVDGNDYASASRALALAPGDTCQVSLQLPWDGGDHEVRVRLDYADARDPNNELAAWTRGVPLLTYVDRTRLEEFREESAGYPQAATDDFYDWLNRHAERMNQMFADKGSPKRVHYDVLATLADDEADPAVDRSPFAIFPFRCRAGEGSFRLSGYYNADEDIDFGLIHELSHQLGLIDIYQLDVPAAANLVSGTGYTAVACMMHGCSPFYSDHSALAMTSWQDDAHGYYGQYLYALPGQLQLRLQGMDGQPLAGATVKVYQYAERPGLGKVITDQIKFTGVTDAQGRWTLPNVDIDENLVPPTGTGDVLHDNPFGYVAVVGTNGVFLIGVEKDGFTDYCWLDITEANVAYWQGQTGTATFERQLRLGGAFETVPAYDLAERNASAWEAWAEGASATAADDGVVRQVGQSSVRMQTDGGFDTYLRYPGDHLASWNLTGFQELRIRLRAQNAHSFQGDNPLIRLIGAGGRFDFVPTTNLLDQANGQWAEAVVPLAGGGQWTRTAYGNVSLTDIRALEIHADTWDYGFTLWVDGVTFWPHPLAGAPDPAANVPARLTLAPAAPNPFNPSTTLAFATPAAGPVTLRIYDARGVLVRTLVDAALPAGWHVLKWDGLDDGGRPASSGLYVARLARDGEVLSRKLSLVK